MRAILRTVAAFTTALALAACTGGGAATSRPTTPVAGSTTGPVATSGAGSTSAASAPCAESTDTTTVAATVADRTWIPATVAAKVGDVITWTNGDGVPHGVELDDHSCRMAEPIPGGGSRSLVFSVAGTFPFHCFIHATMKGTITIS